jgi:alanine racemase
MAQRVANWRQFLSGTHALIDLMHTRTTSRSYGHMRPVPRSWRSLRDGYGHGAVACGRAAVDTGADWLGVARISEALLLRRQGIDARFSFSARQPAEIKRAIGANVTRLSGALKRATP